MQQRKYKSEAVASTVSGDISDGKRKKEHWTNAYQDLGKT